MIKSLISTCLIISTICLYGQDCTYSKNEVDKFEGYHAKITTHQSIFNSHDTETGTMDISLSLSKFSKNGNEQRAVTVYFRERFGKLISADETSELLIMLSNDSIVKLKNLSSKLSFSDLNHITVGNISIAEHSMYTNFVLTDHDISLLANNKMTAIRINYKSNRVSVDIPEKVKKKMGGISLNGEKGYNGQLYFMNYLKCID